MENNAKTFWRGVLVGIFIVFALYIYSEPVNANSYQAGDVPWKPLYVKIVND